MSALPALVLFHHPQSRSAGVRMLLEELALPYQVELVDFKNKSAELLAANPLGKVPTLLADGIAVTEQLAIFQFLAELAPAAGLSPAVGDPLRGPYLRWLAIYGSSFEPAMIDKAQQRDSGAAAMSPYGSVAAVEALLRDQLAQGPWLLGERFTAVDVLWAGSLSWITQFGLLEKTPEIAAYIDRFVQRPAVQAARQKDADLLASMA
jgi:glutathione S-transferase